jgi:hypothetical protein
MTATDCAKAVETFLKAQEFTQSVAIERKDRAYFVRKEMRPADPWRVKIKRGSINSEIESRSTFRDAVVIEIGMGKVVDAADQEAVDLAADFVEEVMRKFAPGRIGSAGPTLTEIAAGGAFPPQDGQADQLADVYVGVVSLTFTLFR